MATLGKLGSTSLAVTFAILTVGHGCGGSASDRPPQTVQTAKTSSTSTTTARSATMSLEQEASRPFTEPNAPPLQSPAEPRSVEPSPLLETTPPESHGKRPEAAKPVTTLSDDEVVTVLVVANEGEVAEAELALKRASNGAVKQFAGTMKMQHTQATQKAKALQAKAKLKTVPSDLSTTLDDDVTATLKDLRTKEGAAFDRAYIDSQAKAHKDVLAAIDDRLMPSTSNGEVKSLLSETRRQVAEHLVKAEEIRDRLSGASSSPVSSRSR